MSRTRYTLIEKLSDKSLWAIEQSPDPITYEQVSRYKATIHEDDLEEHEVGLFDEVEVHTACLSDECVADVIRVDYGDEQEWDDPNMGGRDQDND